MMYKSPIELNFAESICEDVQAQVDNLVIKAVQAVGIDVNKDELVKALTYDRMQYDRGYIDGRMYKPAIVTNADRIRDMTDEELAELFVAVGACFCDDADVCRKWNGACDKCWLDSLKQEAEE